MRKIERLSYSAFSMFEKSPEQFYLLRMSESRAPYEPQGQPAAAGSAFDARVKSSLYYTLFGSDDPKYEFKALFESQVEPQNRDWAIDAGEVLFHAYKKAGFYDSLLFQLKRSIELPRFEFDVRTDICGVPFLAKPDGRWVTPANVKVTHDFKVNGFCSKSATSPHKGYRLCGDGWVGKQSKSNGTAHPAYVGTLYKDIEVSASFLEKSNPAWADQLTLYSWALGEPIGNEDTVLSIHQLVTKPMPDGSKQIRVAEFRARVDKDYQLNLAERMKRCWNAISNQHVFQDMPKEESLGKCQLLDRAAMMMKADPRIAELSREQYRG